MENDLLFLPVYSSTLECIISFITCHRDEKKILSIVSNLGYAYARYIRFNCVQMQCQTRSRNHPPNSIQFALFHCCATHSVRSAQWI